MALHLNDFSDVAEYLLDRYPGQISFEEICDALRECATDHPEASARTVRLLVQCRMHVCCQDHAGPAGTGLSDARPSRSQ